MLASRTRWMKRYVGKSNKVDEKMKRYVGKSNKVDEKMCWQVEHQKKKGTNERKKTQNIME